MSKTMLLGKAIKFNPAESIVKGSQAKKVPMGMLTEFQRKINGFEFSEYNSGPKFRNGDTLVAKITPCLENGKTAFVDILKEDEIAFGSSEFIVLRHTEYTDSEFIYYLARSPLFRERAVSCMEGTSGRKRVNENTLKNLEFVFPDLPTQKSIAKVLSDLDAKIELNNRINRELEAMAKTLYDYWFVQFDFPYSPPTEGCPQDGVVIGKPYKSSGGKMVYNAELKREIPEGWEVKKLGDYASIKKGTLITENTSDPSGKVKVVSAGIDFSYYHSKANYLENTITISASGANAGFINFWREPIFACDCTTIRGKNTADTLQILGFLKMRQEFLYKQARGSAQPHVYPKDIEGLFIPIPPIKLIEEFGKIAVSSNEQVANNQKQNQQLSALRDWLLPMLMNGQVTVKEAEERISIAAEPNVEYKKR